MKTFCGVLIIVACSILAPALCKEVAALDPLTQNIRLTITSSNSVVLPDASLIVAVTITNASTNVVQVGQPICDPGAYEVWATDESGSTRDIGQKRKVNGPGASASGVNAGYQIQPGKSVECAMRVPLKEKLHAGKYAMRLRRWCVVFLKIRPDGTVANSVRRQLGSNAITIEVR